MQFCHLVKISPSFVIPQIWQLSVWPVTTTKTSHRRHPWTSSPSTTTTSNSHHEDHHQQPSRFIATDIFLYPWLPLLGPLKPLLLWKPNAWLLPYHVIHRPAPPLKSLTNQPLLSIPQPTIIPPNIITPLPRYSITPLSTRSLSIPPPHHP